MYPSLFKVLESRSYSVHEVGGLWWISGYTGILIKCTVRASEGMDFPIRVRVDRQSAKTSFFQKIWPRFKVYLSTSKYLYLE